MMLMADLIPKFYFYNCTIINNSHHIILKIMSTSSTQIDYLESVAKVTCYEIDYKVHFY